MKKPIFLLANVCLEGGCKGLVQKPFREQPAKELHDFDEELEEDVLGGEGEGPRDALGVMDNLIAVWGNLKINS